MLLLFFLSQIYITITNKNFFMDTQDVVLCTLCKTSVVLCIVVSVKRIVVKTALRRNKKNDSNKSLNISKIHKNKYKFKAEQQSKNQVPRKSKHPMLTGHTCRAPNVIYVKMSLSGKLS